MEILYIKKINNNKVIKKLSYIRQSYNTFSKWSFDARRSQTLP